MFQLKSVKTPKEFRQFTGGEKLSDMNEIRETTQVHYLAMGDTENAMVEAKKSEPFPSKNKTSSFFTLLQNSEFASLVDKSTGVFEDPSTGLCCMLQAIQTGEFDEPTRYALCIPGFSNGDMMAVQLATCVQQFLGIGGIPPMYKQALKLAQHLNQELGKKGQQLELTGHSMGGGIANYVGVKLGLPSVCFNAAALGRACLKDIGQVSMETLIKQKHVRLEDDFATHPSALRKLVSFFTLGRKTYVPRNVGAIYEIKSTDEFYPSHYDWFRRHLRDAMGDWYKQKNLSKLFG